MSLPEIDTLVSAQHLNLPPLPEAQQRDPAMARWWHELQRVLQERDARIERRLKALED